MATTIKLKTGSGAPLNTDLVQGEPAIDLTNKRLYTEDGTNTVIEIGTNPTEVTTGDLTATGTVTLSSIAYPTSDGTNGQLLATDGAGTLSFINSSSSTNVLNRTATGAISAGDPLMLNSDSTVSKITGVNPELGTNFVVSGAEIEGMVYDTNANKAVILYCDTDNSDYLTAVVATFSGSTITFGTPVVVRAEDSNSGINKIVFDSSNNKVVVASIKDTVETSAKFYVGTVSGSSISFGTAVDYSLPSFSGYANAYNDFDIAFDSTANKVVVARAFYEVTEVNPGISYNVSTKTDIAVGTVSGTSISFGSASSINDQTVNGFFVSSAPTQYINIVYDATANKTLIFLHRFSGYGGSFITKNHFYLGTVSGTSITTGSETEYTVGSGTFKLRIEKTSISYDPDNAKTVFVDYNGNLNFVVVSGSTITFGAGTATTWSSPFVMAYDENLNKTVVLANGVKFYQVGLSGTTFTISNEYDVSEDTFSFPALVYDPDNLNCYGVYTQSGAAYEVVIPASYPTTNYVTDTFIGFAGDAAANGELVPVQLYGVNGDQSAITINQQYYLAYDGTLTTETIKRVQSRNIARGLSATEVLIATPSNI